MPFTAAHPLAVVPLIRWQHRLGLDPTCLVIGSMAPDFEYFVRAEQVSTISHTFAGLWLWDLPATLIVAVLVHAVVKWPMLLVAPVAIARRAASRVARPWRARWSVGAVASCMISAVLGSATHLGWDAFTHSDGGVPARVPVLRTQIALPVVGPMVVHRVLQHASTVVGLIVVAALVLRWLGRGPPVMLPGVPRAAARGLVIACASGAAAWTIARLVGKHATSPGDLIAGVIAGLIAGVIVASAILGSRARRFARAITG